MGNKQQSQPQQNPSNQLTEDEIRERYERIFSQAPTVEETIVKQPDNEKEKQSQPQKQNQTKPEQMTQDDTIEQEQPQYQPPELNQPQLMDLWISKIFDLSVQDGTFQQMPVNLKEVIPGGEKISTQLLCDDTIMLILTSRTYFKSDPDKVDWLIQVIERLSASFNLTQLTTIIKINNQSLEFTTQDLIQLLTSCCSFLTTLVLLPQIFDIQNIPNEDPHHLQQMFQQQLPVNQLADRLYQSLFKCCTDQAFHVYMTYIDGEAAKDDRNLLIELVLKRLLAECQVTLLDQSRLLNAIELMSYLSDYPNTLNHMLEESLAFYHPKIARNGRELQQNTVMGRLLSLSTFPKDNQEWKTFFYGILQYMIFLVKPPHRGIPEQQLTMVRDKIRRVLENVHKLLMKVAKRKNMRDKVLSYFSTVLALNLDKEKIFNMQLQATCSSPGFINNIVHMLLRFCSPFLTNLPTMREKSSTIDYNLISYLKKHPLLSKIYAQTDLLNPQLTPLLEPEEFLISPQFVGALYLLTMKALHQHIPTITEYFKYMEEIHKLNTKGQEAQLLQLLPIKAAYEVALLDKENIELTIKFLTFECLVPMSLLMFDSPIEEESKSQIIQNIPIPDIKYPYGVLPCTFLEDIHELLSVYINSNSPVLNDYVQEIQIQAEFLTLTISHRRLVSNPHLRVKGIETIAMFIPHKTNPRQKDPNLHLVFSQSKIIRANLIQGLIKVFVDAEKTGQSNQFYDKFRFRFYFCKTFNYLLQNLKEIYSSQLEQMSKNDKETFLEFANLYLNDMIFLLDECLGKMKAMKIIEEQDQSTLPQSEQMELTMQYKEHKRLFQSFSFYLHEYYKNIQIISESEPESFMTEEIREKLVNNMNYTVEQLNGQNALQYKTKAMKEVNFQPKFIMGNVIELYINFSKNQDFLEQIVKDQRSFSIPLFQNTALKLIKHNIITQDQFETFSQMMKTLEKMLKTKQLFDEAIMSDPSSIPDEFLDPLSCELIRDPVQLPNSNVVIDRITIKKHLLNDKSDPFNRSPLTEDMLIEMPELKQKIDKFILDQIAKQKTRN